MKLIATLPEKATWDVDKYCIVDPVTHEICLAADSKSELRFKMTIAGLTIGKCVEKPAEFMGIRQFRYAVFDVHDLRSERHEQEKQ